MSATVHPTQQRVASILAKRLARCERKLELVVELLKKEKARTEVLSVIAVFVLPAKPGVH